MNTGTDRGGSAANVPGLLSSKSSAPRREARKPRRVQPMPSPVTGRVSPSAAAIARPFLVLLPVLTFLIPSMFLALSKAPTYTAESRLLVGGFDVQAQAVPGFVAASGTLASTYARLVSTPAIVDPTAKALRMSPATVAGHISASSVPESSIIRVQGSAANQRDAVRFADAAAAALLKYTQRTANSASGPDLLAQYQAASQEYANALSDLNRFNRAVGNDANPSPALLQQQATATAAAAAAKLKADSLGTRYTNLAQASGTSGDVQVVAPATPTGNNRKSTIELAIAASVGMGLVAGLALATVVVNQAATRRRELDGTGRAAP